MQFLLTQRINPARSELIGSFVETYLTLNEEEQKMYNEQSTALEENQTVLLDDEAIELPDNYISRLIREGRLEEVREKRRAVPRGEWERRMAEVDRWSAGRKKALEEGREEGIQLGKEEGLRNVVLRQLTRRFGVLPEVTEARIHDLSLAPLEALTEALLDFQSLADLDAWLQQ